MTSAITIATISFEDGAPDYGTGIDPDTTFNMYAVKMNSDGSYQDLSAVYEASYGSTYGYNPKVRITLSPAALEGEQYRIYYSGDNKGMISFYHDTVVANASGELLIGVNPSEYLGSFSTNILTFDNIRYNFYGYSESPTVVTPLEITAIPELVTPLPAGTYDLYICTIRETPEVDGICTSWSVPLAVSDLDNPSILDGSTTLEIVGELSTTTPTAVFLFERTANTFYEIGYFSLDNNFLGYTIDSQLDSYENIVNVFTNNESTWTFSPPPIPPDDPYLETSTFTPSFLNMSGQMGIFKAGTRLGFWDSMNSVAWSSNTELNEFTPSIENLAGNLIFAEVKGRIVVIKAHGEGFIIYSTKSIVGVNLSLSSTILWDSKAILDKIGIDYSRAVCNGQSNKEHYIYTTGGMFLIGKFNALSGSHEVTNLIPDVYDYLKESRSPVGLDIINSRYLFISLVNPDYIYGKTSFENVNVSPLLSHIKLADGYWDGDISLLGTDNDGNYMYTVLKTILAGNTGGFRTRLGRHWRTRWNGSITRMDVNKYTNIEALTWVETHDGYVHPSDSLDLWIHPDKNVLADIEADVTPDLDLCSPLIVPPVAPLVGFLAGDYEFEFVDLEYREAIQFSCLDEGDIGSKIYLQLMEWEDFTTSQKATADYLEGKTLTGDRSSEFPQSFLAGDGPIKMIVNDTQVVLRKYFTDDYVVSAETDAEETRPWDGILRWTLSNAPTTNTSLYNNTAPWDPQHEWVDTVGLPYALARAQSNMIEPISYSAGSINIRDLIDAFIFSLSDFVDRIGGFITFIGGPTLTLNSVFECNNAKAYINNNPFKYPESLNISLDNSTFALLDTGLFMPPCTGWFDPMPAFSEVNIGAAGFSWSISNGYMSYSCRIDSYIEQGGLNPNEYAMRGIAGYTKAIMNTIPITTTLHVTKTPISSSLPTYSEARFNLSYYDLIEPLGGGNYRVVASYPVARKNRINFDNLYPDYSGKVMGGAPPSAFITIEDNMGNQMVTMVPIDFDTGIFGDAVMELTDAYIPPTANSGDYIKYGEYHPPVVLSVTYPGTDYLLQSGSITNLYSTFVGALVYDLHLKKWGKLKATYSVLIDMNPANNAEHYTLTYTHLGIDAAILNSSSGFVVPFDSKPLDSWMRYGKIGYYRVGFVHGLEMKLGFRNYSSGIIKMDASMDGRTIDPSLQTETEFLDAAEVTHYINQRARWFTITVSGNYDLQYMEFRGNISGRR